MVGTFHILFICNSCSYDRLYGFHKIFIVQIIVYFLWFLTFTACMFTKAEIFRFWKYFWNVFGLSYHICHCSMFSTTNSDAAMARWLLDVGPGWLQQHHWCSHWRGKTLATRHHFAQWVSMHKNLDKAKRLHARFHKGNEHESSHSHLSWDVHVSFLPLKNIGHL